MLDPPPDGLHFNVSHSGDRLPVGATAVGPLGVDIEQRGAFRNFNHIVEYTFSPSELAVSREVDPAGRGRVLPLVDVQGSVRQKLRRRTRHSAGLV
jgi:phosphopantetheinyl transferase